MPSNTARGVGGAATRKQKRQQALIRVSRSGYEYLPNHLNLTVANQIAAFKAPAS